MKVYTTYYRNDKGGTGWKKQNKTNEIKITIHFRSPSALKRCFEKSCSIKLFNLRRTFYSNDHCMKGIFKASLSSVIFKSCVSIWTHGEG